MTKLKILFIAIIAIAVAVSIMIWRQNQTKWLAGAARLQGQSNQLTALIAENERLSNLYSLATNARPNDHAAELERLRSESEALKKQTNQLDKPLTRAAADGIVIPNIAADDDRTSQEKISQMRNARYLGMAFMMYALDHQGQTPSGLDQLTSYLAKRNLPFSETNQFEIVYQGSLDKLQGIPRNSIAIIRSQQTWQGADGKLSRAYGFLDGHSQLVGSDDNFQSFEALHVISAPQTGQTQ